MYDLLVPRATLPYLEVAAPTAQHHVELAPVRREALDVLAAAYRSPVRLLLGLLAWAAVVGAVALGVLLSEPVVLVIAGAVVLGLVGVGLAVVVVRAGARLTRAAAGWLQIPAVGVGGRDAGPLYGAVRGRTVLALLAGALTVALLVVLVMLTSRGAVDAGLATLLAVGAVATAAAAVATFGGVRRLILAGWARPTVAASQASTAYPPPASGQPPFPPGYNPLPPLAPPQGTPVAVSPPAPAPAVDAAPAPAPRRVEPPTVELNLYPDLAAPQPPRAEDVAPPSAATGPSSTELTVQVLLSSGQALQHGVTLIGRRPVARPEDVVDDVLVLTDQTVTKTHATITVEQDVVRVVDRASTNGTVLEAPDGSLTRCRPWQVTTVLAPAIIHLGHTRLLVRPLPAHRPLEVA